MKTRHRIAFLLLACGALLACVPVLYSLHQARKQAIQEKYAALDDLTLRLDQQVRSTMDLLSLLRQEMQSSGDAPCSPAGVARLQRFGLRSQIVKSSLYLSDRRVACSSGGALLSNLLLGAPVVTQPDGTSIYTQVQVPGVTDKRYVVLENNGYALLIYPDGLISPFIRPDIALGLFSTQTHRFAARHGKLQDSWARAFQPDQPYERFLDKDTDDLVVRRVVPPGSTGTVAATPRATTDTRMAQFARWFIPLGLAAGLVILAIAFLLTRHQFSSRAELLHALQKGQFFLLYQPIFHLQSNTCIGAEALLRWRHEDGTVIPPDRFIPFAEDSGLIHLVTRRVLELVQKDMTRFLRRNPDFHIGVNLSPRDLQSHDTVKQIEELIQSIGPGAGKFVVEATERGLLEQESAIDVVNAIHALGVDIAIDDFGTGYSSLAYLATYPFDILKIDKSFTSTACTDAVTSQVALHIIELARTLGMRTLVEGIETREQADLFRSKGVIYGQGYLFGRPMPAAELINFVPLHSSPDQHRGNR
jgi:sensor c-di-GMP phosphodiesterase-like protein